MTNSASVLLPRDLAAEDPGVQAQATLFETHALACKEPVYAACLALVRRRDEADDLFQETYLRAFRFFHQFTPGTNCRAWLLTIMYNVFRNHYPQRLRDHQMLDIDRVTNEYEEQLSVDGDNNCHDPAVLFAARRVDKEILEAIHTLPEEYRSTFLLVDMGDLTYEEAAAVLGCPTGTVRSRLARARRALRAALEGYAREHGYLRDNSPQLEHVVSLEKAKGTL
ncbi:MAG: sigma-70 family RNA polymerase sigma factor [Deltaproteobacteria bacterium]|nr:sigma-70 family RNA polymerase sigma factor [Deltaproteobacteria bacterium]